MARRFRVTCPRCGMVLFTAVDRIDEPELRVLRGHLRALHSGRRGPRQRASRGRASALREADS